MRPVPSAAQPSKAQKEEVSPSPEFAPSAPANTPAVGRAALAGSEDDRATPALSPPPPRYRVDAPATAAPTGRPLSAVVATDLDGRQARVTPRSARAVAWVEGVRARTLVDLVFVLGPGVRAADFRYTLPADAVPAGFSVFDAAQSLGPKLQAKLFRRSGGLAALAPGFLAPDDLDRAAPVGSGRIWSNRRDGVVELRAEATEAAEADQRIGRTASTLNWAGGRQVRIDLGAVAGGRPVRVVLAYEETLEVRSNGKTAYAVRLPADAQRRAVTLFSAARPVSGPRGRRSRAGRWHRRDLTRAPADPRWTFDVGPGPIVLRGADADGLPGDFYYVRYRLPSAPPAASSTRDAVFALDVSRRPDVDGAAARQVELMSRILADDPSIRRYAVLVYNIGARWLHGPEWRNNTAADRAATVAALGGVDRDGASDPSTAIEAVLSAADWLGTEARGFLLTTGARTWGPADARMARRARAGSFHWRVYALSGQSSDPELNQLAADEGHPVVPVFTRDAIGSAAVAHRAGPSRPLEIVVSTGHRRSGYVPSGCRRWLSPVRPWPLLGAWLPVHRRRSSSALLANKSPASP